MVNRPGTGKLFQDEAHSTFIRLTGQRYDAMDTRMEKRGLRPLQFSKAQFRSHILEALNGQEDGVAKCRYCGYYFGIKDLAVDHAIPLSRGGSPGLDNLEYICRPDNNRKGSLNPTEYLALLEFLETLPFARVDVLKRLEQSVQLAAGAAAIRGTVGELKKSGAWGATQAEMRARKKAKESGLDRF